MPSSDGRPPWLRRDRKSVTLTARSLAKVVEVARDEGIPFSTALDALVRVAPTSKVAELVDADAGAIASWRLHGDSEG